MWNCIAWWVVPDRSKTCTTLSFEKFSGPLVMDHSTELLRKRATYSFETSEPTASHLDEWNPLLYRTYPRFLLWEVLPLSCRVTDCVSLINLLTNSDISIWKLLAVTHNHDNTSVVIKWCYMHYITYGMRAQKWHEEKFLWHAIFTAVSIYFLPFLLNQRFCIVKNMHM